MLGGSFAADMAINGALNDADDASRRAANWKAQCIDMQDYAAENVTIRQALAAQLALLDPKNPLLVDTALIERMKAAGVSAFRTNMPLHFESAREVGRTFKIPPHDNTPRSKPLGLANPKLALKDDINNLRMHYAGALALTALFGVQLRNADPANPMLNDQAITTAIIQEAVMAYVNSGEDFKAARDVGENYKLPAHTPAPVPLGEPKPNLALKDDINQLRFAYAGVIAQRGAFAKQLAMYDPENPLLKDHFLIEKIKEAGATAYGISGQNFDAARQVGQSFSIDRRG